MDTNRGFTLVETLVAIILLLTIVTAAMSMSRQSIKIFTLTQEQVTAIHLAGDAMEYIKSAQITDLNDANGLLGFTDVSTFQELFLSGDGCTTADGCSIDTTVQVGNFGSQQPVIPCASGGCPALRQDTSGSPPTKRFGHYFNDADDIVSNFTRKIVIDDSDLAANSILSVTITVTWGAAANEQFTVTRYLYDIGSLL